MTWDIWVFQGFLRLGQYCQAQPLLTFLFWLDVLSLFGLKKILLKSAGFLTVGFSAEVEVIFSTKFSEGFCCLDWALCCSCLYVELQLLGCNVCCQVFPVFLTLNLPQWVTSLFLFHQVPDFVCLIFSEGSCCFGLSSVSFLPLCWASVAGLHCLLPSTS